jgi:hypothetical protein
VKSKYHSIKTRVSTGKIVDSRKEARRYEQLLLLQRAGAISDLRTQVRYELIPAQYVTIERYGKDGKRLKDGQKLLERKVEYVADFVYYDNMLKREVVEDTKGVRTADYIIKRKLMLRVHGIRIHEI